MKAERIAQTRRDGNEEVSVISSMGHAIDRLNDLMRQISIAKIPLEVNILFRLSRHAAPYSRSEPEVRVKPSRLAIALSIQGCKDTFPLDGPISLRTPNPNRRR